MRCLRRFRRQSVLAFLTIGFGIFSRDAKGQDWSDEVTPQVQQLYVDAKMARQRGDTQGSIAKYQAMLKLAPHLAPAYNNLGSLYFDDHAYDKAADVLRAGLALDPGMNTAQALLGLSDAKLAATKRRRRS